MSNLLERFSKHKEEYQNASPYPHIILEEVWDPIILSQILQEWPEKDNKGWRKMGEKEKTVGNYFMLTGHSFMGPTTTKFFEKILNGPDMIEGLRALTGISSLNPNYGIVKGTGLHQVDPGGYLNIHIDKNWAKGQGKRMVSMIIYLNEKWEKQDGGELELWDKDLTKAVLSIPPTFNKTIISSAENTYHGYPDPTGGKYPRRSLAMFYYSQERVRQHRARFVSPKDKKGKYR